jgi:hypothetical protein
MPSVITVEQLAEMVCRALDIPAKDNAENLSEILRPAWLLRGRLLCDGKRRECEEK